MYSALVKKDFDILFRGNVVILFVQMLFILIIISANMGVIGYGAMATAFGWQLLMSVSAKEKANNSLGLLIAISYEKAKIITTRYMSAMLAFLGVTVIYELLALITNIFHIGILRMLTPELFFITMCAYAMFISITLPLYFKFDDTIVRGISLFLIMAVIMVGFLLWDLTDIGSKLSTLTFLKDNIIVISIVITIISLVVSRKITMKIFRKMEF